MIIPAKIYAVTLGSLSFFVIRVNANPASNMTAIGIITLEVEDLFCKCNTLSIMFTNSPPLKYLIIKIECPRMIDRLHFHERKILERERRT